MNNASQLLVTTCSIASAILVISIIASQVLFKNRTHQNNALAIPSLVLAVFALLTGWCWFYYANLFFTLPFFVVSVALNLMLWRREPRHRWIKSIVVIQISAVVLALVTAIWFSLERS